jgi:hypothetical protein
MLRIGPLWERLMIPRRSRRAGGRPEAVPVARKERAAAARGGIGSKGKGRGCPRPPLSLAAGPAGARQAVGAGELLVDHLRERLERLRAREHAAVDEDRRGAGDTRLGAGLHVGGDPLGVGAAVEAGIELRRVEAETGGGRLQIGDGELLLVGEHRVVHLPELALVVGAQRRLGGFLGVRVDAVERELPEHDADLVAVAAAHLVDRRHDARAERALEVGELDDRHRRGLRALRGVAGDLDLGARLLEEDLDGMLGA